MKLAIGGRSSTSVCGIETRWSTSEHLPLIVSSKSVDFSAIVL